MRSVNQTLYCQSLRGQAVKPSPSTGKGDPAVHGPCTMKMPKLVTPHTSYPSSPVHMHVHDLPS